MKLLNKVLLVFLVIGAGLALLLGSFIYTTEYKVSYIDSDISADGNHEIILQAVGEPDCPSGYSHARLALTDKNEKGETVFSTSINDFIRGFNCVYKKMYSEDYLTPSLNWIHIHGKSPCLEYDSIHYIFSADKQIASMPRISIYTPENKDGIYEIELTFDDHGYQESLYKEFKKICLCSLKIALPELENSDIIDLYENLYLQAKENFWGDYYADSGAERPSLNIIYQYSTVGFYGYYGAGTANICIIPLSQENIVQFIQEGVEIIEIK